MIDLTALLICHDRKFNLDFCLNSINFCDPKPYTIVVDYGSVIPISYPEYNDWCTVVRLEKPEKEFIKARAYNYGITFVKTKFICCTDIDEIFCKTFFGKIYDTLNKDIRRFVKCNTYWIEQLPDNINFNNINENYDFLINNYAKYCIDKAYFSKTGKKRNRGGGWLLPCNGFKYIKGYRWL